MPFYVSFVFLSLSFISWREEPLSEKEDFFVLFFKISEGCGKRKSLREEGKKKRNHDLSKLSFVSSLQQQHNKTIGLLGFFFH